MPFFQTTYTRRSYSVVAVDLAEILPVLKHLLPVGNLVKKTVALIFLTYCSACIFI